MLHYMTIRESWGSSYSDYSVLRLASHCVGGVMFVCGYKSSSVCLESLKQKYCHAKKRDSAKRSNYLFSSRRVLAVHIKTGA